MFCTLSYIDIVHFTSFVYFQTWWSRCLHFVGVIFLHEFVNCLIWTKISFWQNTNLKLKLKQKTGLLNWNVPCTPLKDGIPGLVPNWTNVLNVPQPFSIVSQPFSIVPNLSHFFLNVSQFSPQCFQTFQKKLGEYSRHKILKLKFCFWPFLICSWYVGRPFLL